MIREVLDALFGGAHEPVEGTDKMEVFGTVIECSIYCSCGMPLTKTWQKAAEDFPWNWGYWLMREHHSRLMVNLLTLDEREIDSVEFKTAVAKVLP